MEIFGCRTKLEMGAARTSADGERLTAMRDRDSPAETNIRFGSYIQV